MYIKLRKMLYFCFIMLIIGTIFLVVKTPLKLVSTEVYPVDYRVKEINLPIIQQFTVDVTNFSGILINFGDNSLNDLDYGIELFDEDNKLIVSKEFKNYNSNLVDLRFNMISNSKNKKFTLKINSIDETNSKVNILLSDNFDERNYIENFDGVMRINSLHYVKNYGYFWYICMFLTIVFILLVSLEGEVNVEK